MKRYNTAPVDRNLGGLRSQEFILKDHVSPLRPAQGPCANSLSRWCTPKGVVLTSMTAPTGAEPALPISLEVEPGWYNCREL